MVKQLGSISLMSSVAAITILMAAGHVEAADATKDVVVGAIYLDTQGYYAGVRKGIQDEAAALGKNLNIIETNAQGDISKESSFIDRITAAKVNAIILSAVSTDGSVRALRTANKAGIPIICYNTCVNDDAVSKYVYAYVVGNPTEFGSKAGDAAAEYFKAAGLTEPKIGVINCEAFEVCVARRKGFEAALKAKVPGAKIVVNQEGTVLDKAISVGEQMLSANPDLNAFFGESGGATLGAVKAVRNRGMVGKTVVFGSDMTSDIAMELKSNEVLKAVVDISGLGVGKQAMDQAMKAIKGRKARLSDRSRQDRPLQGVERGRGVAEGSPGWNSIRVVKVWTPTLSRAAADTGDDVVVARVRGVVKRFPGVLALDRVDFEIHAGEVRALLGKNGAGKSTLIRILTGASAPDVGEVSILGHKLEQPGHSRTVEAAPPRGSRRLSGTEPSSGDERRGKFVSRSLGRRRRVARFS